MSYSKQFNSNSKKDLFPNPPVRCGMSGMQVAKENPKAFAFLRDVIPHHLAHVGRKGYVPYYGSHKMQVDEHIWQPKGSRRYNAPASSSSPFTLTPPTTPPDQANKPSTSYSFVPTTGFQQQNHKRPPPATYGEYKRAAAQPQQQQMVTSTTDKDGFKLPVPMMMPPKRTRRL